MFVCRDPRLEKWKPDFSSSEQADPDWARVVCDETELTNSLDWLEWDENPVQVQVCDACGHIGCASGGYVHVSRLADLVLWTAPQLDLSDFHERTEYAPTTVLKKLGAVAILAATWDAWPTPRASSLEPANFRCVAARSRPPDEHR
jgi:hypothetical protein